MPFVMFWMKGGKSGKEGWVSDALLLTVLSKPFVPLTPFVSLAYKNKLRFRAPSRLQRNKLGPWILVGLRKAQGVGDWGDPGDT